ncbi:EF-hand domain-containing protein [Roseovarius sp. SCSIO 43702]|uniref:EF-hand domain-containing protein n=1 Tax=Roseovarius sp. SCSIO 43702 TaxID=2823043 RepID=UPI001C73167E|nr:EF-hand domain-containing protein [Roseovarius sp. SCSIO 43702]QYX58325.1 EF-hand domain-containing protein [Roseovarius sp. SCSIO 43702]
MIKYLALIIAMGLIANSAFALSEGVTEIDANGDGVMTIEELRAVYEEMDVETFSEIDLNNDGVIDDDEMVAAQERGLVPATTDG